MYDSPDDDPVRSSACSVGTNQSFSSNHERAWVDPYIEASSDTDKWIMKHIKRDGFIDDVCRHPSVNKARISSMNDKFASLGLVSRLVFKDGNNELYLE
ncbi:MAG: hypothetical protein ACYCY6_00615 [Minisyncoccota bacterium]